MFYIECLLASDGGVKSTLKERKNGSLLPSPRQKEIKMTLVFSGSSSIL